MLEDNGPECCESLIRSQITEELTRGLLYTVMLDKIY